MALTDSFTFVTKQPNWTKKIFIGSLITVIPFFGGAVSNGYQMEVYRNLAGNSPNPLPEWKNVGAFFGNGLRLLLAVYVFYIPGLILSIIGWILGFSRIVTIVMMLYDVDYQTRMGVSVGAYIAREIVLLALGIVLGSILPLAFLFVPAMVRRCAKYNSFLSALNFPAHFSFIFTHLGDYVLAYIAVLVTLFLFSAAAGALGAATVWIAGLGTLVAWFGVAMGRFWTRLMWAYNLAQMDFADPGEQGSFPPRDTNPGYRPPPANMAQKKKSSNTGLALFAGCFLVVFMLVIVLGGTIVALILNGSMAEQFAAANKTNFNKVNAFNSNGNRPMNYSNMNANLSNLRNVATNANTYIFNSSPNSNAKPYVANTAGNTYFNDCVLNDYSYVVTDDDDVLETMQRGNAIHIIPNSQSGKWFKVETKAGTIGWMNGWDITLENCDEALNNANRYKK